MDNNEQRPSAALINREWYGSASDVLDGEELGKLLVYAVDYVLYGMAMPTGDDKVGIVCAMIKPALDSDIAKYRERCARNAANAKSQRQRVAASGSEWQRVAENTTTTTTPITTTTTTINKSLSEEDQRKRDWYLLFGYFWSTGSNAVSDELNAFWSYYESLGWKNNKGAAIVSKVAAARMWKRQFDNKQPPAGADAWYAALKDCPIPDVGAFTCYLGAERTPDGVVVRLGCKGSYYESMTEAVPNLEATLKRLWNTQDLTIVTRGSIN